MPDAILDLTLRTARTPAVGLDVAHHLQELCRDLVRLVRVTAAVVVVVDPSEAHGSDDTATLMGAAQRGAAVGPVANALRTRRPMITPDLTRVGPPALAAAAADCGLTSSGAVPLCALDRAFGVLQLLGTRTLPVEPAYLDLLGPLPDVLAAQLANIAALRPGRGQTPAPVDAADLATDRHVVVPASRPRPAHELPPLRPWQRRPSP